MATEPTTDPAQRDLLWVGYSPRAMLPAVVLTAIASLVVWTGQYFLQEVSDFVEEIGALLWFLLSWGVWPALIFMFLYRTVTFTYRLTDRALLVDFGMLSRPVLAVGLPEITAVDVRAGWLARMLGIGCVEVSVGGAKLRLKGVRNPEAFAAMIRNVQGGVRA